MRNVNNIAERDALRPAPVLCEAQLDGSWICYDNQAELPPQYQPVDPPQYQPVDPPV